MDDQRRDLFSPPSFPYAFWESGGASQSLAA